MSDEKNVEVDPRFDPAFQRGFDQTIPVDEYVPDPLPRKIATAAAPAAPVVAPPQVAPVPAAAPKVQAASILPAGSEFYIDVERDTEPEPDPEPDSSPSRNPFLLFLGIISIALVAAGIWLFVRSGDAFNSSDVRSQGDYMSLDATIHMAPFIALLGGATAIGVVFVFASKWKRRR
jgi:hypothetical protein